MSETDNKIDPAAMRADYTHGELRREDLNADPIQQFALWFEQAVKAQIPEPNAMSLATVSAEGQPSLKSRFMRFVENASAAAVIIATPT